MRLEATCGTISKQRERELDPKLTFDKYTNTREALNGGAIATLNDQHQLQNFSISFRYLEEMELVLHLNEVNPLFQAS